VSTYPLPPTASLGTSPGETQVKPSTKVVELKRSFYLVSLGILAVASFVMWAFAGGSTMTRASFAFPIMGVACLAGMLVLWIRPYKVTTVERATYWLACLVLLASLFFNLDDATTPIQRLTALQMFSFWPKALAVWAFLAFGSKRGLLVTLGFAVATGGVFVQHVLGGAQLEPTSVLHLAQFTVSGVLFLVMLFAFAHILERQVLARTEAEVEARFATLDALTGLPNRRALEGHFVHARARVHRTGESLAVYFLDVDDFKLINDTFGHDGGDSMLRQFARRLPMATRNDDLVARVGGDEFVVLASVTDEAHARLLAQRLVTVFEAPFEIQGSLVSLHPSIGMSIYPQDGIALETMLSRADAAMYQAKADGKNGWVAASRHLTSSAVTVPS